MLRRLVANGGLSLAALDRIRSEQLSVVSANAQVGAIAAPAAAFILAFSLARDGLVSSRIATTWVACVAASHALGFLLGYAYRRGGNRHGSWRIWTRLMVAVTGVTGLCWGIGALFLVTQGGAGIDLWVAIVVCAVVAGSAIAFGSYLPIFYAVLFPTLVPYILWSLAQGGDLQYRLGGLATVYLLALLVAGCHFNGAFVEALRLRFENVELVDQLRIEKARAEQASIDKSRFLAAASHDLRQPVHALSMFVGTLQAHELTADLRQLARQMNNSLSALDDLFASLLDISRFDANAVKVRQEVFPIDWLIERVCDGEQVEARKKGLRLIVRRSSLIVRTDPILMERILRNLVSNAVRHTVSGRVVVGCRRGRLASVQVWDTGPGIPVEEQGRIFDEFYQLGNPERDRNKGLGLGLAIAKRSAELLDCPLTLCSKVGTGSVFKVAMPIAAEAPAATANERPVKSPATARGPILVVDDEAAVQASMSGLLTRWGYDVIAAGTGDEVLRKTAAVSAPPSLIICDYRLRGEENGIAVVQRLRSEYNHDIPALLITGDTAPDRLRDAQASGLPLLYKPVTDARLRTALTDLLSAG